MAKNQLGANSAPVTLPVGFPPLPAVLNILARFNRDQLASFIEVALDLANAIDGDPDAEVTRAEDDFVTLPPGIEYGPGCIVADAGENAWIEWDQMRGGQRNGPNIAQGHEDDEEDSADRGLDEAEPDMRSYAAYDASAGCPIADPGGDEHDGKEPDPDTEIEQMRDDVPMLSVQSLDYCLFTDKRWNLGISNLQTSFRTNSEEVRSADSGAVLVTRGFERKPGVPV